MQRIYKSWVGVFTLQFLFLLLICNWLMVCVVSLCEGRHKFFLLIFRIISIGFKLHLDLILTHRQDKGTVPITVYLFGHYNNIKVS